MIGGFSLAAKWVWGNEHKIHIFVEIDPFCQKVLKKHWPKVSMISDIKEYKHDGTNIDLLTGGFPCQPFSVAGKQRGKEDDRYLWPEMLRIISEVHPTWIIGENVNGIINMELNQVLSDLESEGYEVQPFIIPACAKNAPHRRDRVWIVANSINGRSQKRWPKNNREMERCTSCRETSSLFGTTPPQSDSHASNSTGRQSKKPTEREGWQNISRGNKQAASDSSNQGLQRCKRGGTHEKKQTAYRPIAERNNTWDKPWLEVATRLCRVDDGLPRRMDRANRLKALGNAIVPQVVVPIMQAIKHIEDQKQNQS